MRIEELTADDRDEIVEVFAHAFHYYPVFTYVLEDADLAAVMAEC